MNDLRLTHVPDIDWAVRQVLRAPGGGIAAPASVRAFLRYLEVSGSSASATIIDAPSGQEVLMVTRLPGRVGMILVSPPTQPELAAVHDTIRQFLATTTQDLGYLQALIDPSDANRRALLTGAGFAALTTLVYLERGVAFPWVDEPPNDMEWNDWSDDLCERFQSAIAASYIDSLDCPELTGMRTMDEILAAHRAAGVFHSGLWQLARRNGDDVGVLLLAEVPMARGMEIVYLGVLPDARRSGAGRALMQRAFELARRHRSRLLTVVVDERNVSARRLYESLSFHEVARREALWLRHHAI